jgi:hypothetical protein
VSSDLGCYLRDLRKRGYTITWAGSGHQIITDGTRRVTVISSTPRGGRRSLDNLKSTIRRYERQDKEKTDVPS